jgi:hypothetical protein
MGFNVSANRVIVEPAHRTTVSRPLCLEIQFATLRPYRPMWYIPIAVKYATVRISMVSTRSSASRKELNRWDALQLTLIRRLVKIMTWDNLVSFFVLFPFKSLYPLSFLIQPYISQIRHPSLLLPRSPLHCHSLLPQHPSKNSRHLPRQDKA